MASRVSAFIVDDEFHARENLKMLLEDFCPEVDVIGTADGVKSALSSIPQHQPQLLFLDIRMPSGAEGFDLLEQLELEHCQVIFVTAFKDYAIRAFKANAIHYLLKPVDPEELKEAVDKATQLLLDDQLAPEREQLNLAVRSLKNDISASGPEKITIRHAKGFKIVKVQNILRLEASGNCTWIYFKDGSKYFDTRTLGVYEEILSPNQFMRIHKSHLINLNAVIEYRSESGPLVILENGDQAPVARARLAAFHELFKGS